MEDTCMPKSILNAKAYNTRRRGRSQIGWIDNATDHLHTINLKVLTISESVPTVRSELVKFSDQFLNRLEGHPNSSALNLLDNSKKMYAPERPNDSECRVSGNKLTAD